MHRPTVVLLVTSSQTCGQLSTRLESLDDVTVLSARDCREARRSLSMRPDVSVVFTQVSHPDGNWSDLLRFVVNGGIEAQVVVCATQADEGLWSEVLWRGGFDVLVQPCEREDLRRVLEGAVRAKDAALGRMRATVA
jgi:DNA-binding NtrC family response regulator